MRLSTVALSLLALGVTSIAAGPSEPTNNRLVSRDFARKMQVRDARKHNIQARSAEVDIEARDIVEDIEPRRTVYKTGELTWYSGGQLNNPACGGKAPSSSDHVVAVKQGGKFHCGQTLHLHYGGKMVAATVRDYCQSCSDMHLDATLGLFEEFASKDTGEIHNVHIVPM